jgi:hypothetical protein
VQIIIGSAEQVIGMISVIEQPLPVAPSFMDKYPLRLIMFFLMQIPSLIHLRPSQ